MAERENNQTQEPAWVPAVYLEALAYVGLALYRYRFDGTLLYADRAAIRLLDLEDRYPDPSQVIGLNLGDLFEYIEEPGSLRAMMKDQGRVQNYDYAFRTLKGEIRWVRHDSYLTLDEASGEQVVQAIVMDITARKRAEEALGMSEERMRVLLEAAEDVIFAFDADLRFVFINRVAARMLRTSPVAAVGKSIDEFFTPEQAARQAQAVRQVFESGQAQVADALPTATPSGERWFSTVLSPIRDVDGQVQTVLGISRDITDKVEADRKRAELEQQVRHAQKLESLGILAGGIAHDFNNLLVAVLGNADLALMDLPVESPAVPAVEQIRNAAVRASDLTNQMLAYAGRGRFAVRALDLNLLVEEMIRLVKVSVPKQVSLQFNLCSDLPAVMAEAAQLQQVILNLVTNAAEAVGEADGLIRIRTTEFVVEPGFLTGAVIADEGVAPGRYVMVEVTDSGAGMDADTRARIFDPFYTTKFTGRGLGLAAVLGIVRSHSGIIRVESEPGQGATFQVLLPASEQVPEVAVGSGGDLLSWRGSGRVLVDDEPFVRQVAGDMLCHLGFEVCMAVDGLECMALAEEFTGELRLVLLDMTMPNMNGEETFRALHERWPELPVLLCSGFTEAESTARFEGAGLAGFLQKPFKLAHLIEKLRQVLDRK